MRIYGVDGIAIMWSQEMNTQQSATPFTKPDYRAKPHPKPTKWRRGLVRQACYEAIARELGVAS